MNFILIGAAGYIAPRHMEAIKSVNGHLIAAYDPFDSVGILDTYFPNCDFFTEFERLDRHVIKLQQKGVVIDYVSICSPNYLHDAHIRFGLRIGAKVICEKPLVLNTRNLKSLIDYERSLKGEVNCILQLRLHPEAIRLKKQFEVSSHSIIHFDYFTSRGKWYLHSWKGSSEKSGGIATNIGVHFFDFLIWIFGSVQNSTILELNDTEAKGVLELERAKIFWHLGIDINLIPKKLQNLGQRTYRRLLLGDAEFDFSKGFTELHNLSYERIISGNGFKMSETLPAINLVENIRK